MGNEVVHFVEQKLWGLNCGAPTQSKTHQKCTPKKWVQNPIIQTPVGWKSTGLSAFLDELFFQHHDTSRSGQSLDVGGGGRRGLPKKHTPTKREVNMLQNDVIP